MLLKDYYNIKLKLFKTNAGFFIDKEKLEKKI